MLKPGKSASAIDAALMAAAGAAIAYLAYKAFGASLRPGYDLRFFWVAGQLWMRGVNPYTDDYEAYAVQLITAGFVPDFWPYPPTLFFLTAPLGLMSLGASAAFVAWLNFALVIAASALIADIAVGAADRERRRRFFCAHIFTIAALEGAALTIVVGQMAIVAYFGAALAWWGIARGRAFVGGAGLALVMLKPQIGLLIAPLLLFAGPVSRRAVLLGAGISFALAAPPHFIAIDTVLDWLVQVQAYDDVQHANGPTAMTGVRAIVYAMLGADIGNLAAMAIAFAIAVCVGLFILRRTRADNAPALFQSGVLVAIAAAPLHVYDFVILGLALDRLARLKGPAIWIALVGAALVWRSENIARAFGLHAAEAVVFPGSLLASLGALAISIAALIVARDEPANTDAALAGKAEYHKRTT